MIKGLIFDLRGVIVFNNNEQQIKDFAKELNIDLEKVRKMEEDNEKKMIIGKLSVKELCSAIRGTFKIDKDSDELVLIWDKNYEKNTIINKELLIKIREIKQKYSVGLISEIFDTTARIHQKQGIYQNFKPVVLSCRSGTNKFEEKMFKKAINDIGFKPSECLYIDDDEKHLATAKEMKMNIIKFKDNQQLFKELKKLKIIK
ncbi:MAG: HAD-IA family hydrolase [Candidatus ainarchaeum sp.]|nr:HAD-IA family hydrolase [Candidatus ainarchaeum sp.]